MSVQELAMRKFNNSAETINPLGSVIVNADCIFEDGKFIMKSLPAPLPSLYTIRFTAPADFTQGNTIVINGTEMPLRVPLMINASSAIFRAGAVFHIDIDMDRQVAFAWGNQGGGSGNGTTPDLSYDEQFAGYHDHNGDKVYCKTLDLGQFPGKSDLSATDKYVPMNISGLKKMINMIVRWENTDGSRKIVGPASRPPNSTTYFHTVDNNFGIFVVGTDRRTHTGEVTLYYTCTDR